MANAVEAILSEPRARRGSRDGADYLRKEDYGKVPEYLSDVKMEIEREREMVEDMMPRSREEEDTRVSYMAEGVSVRRHAWLGWSLLTHEQRRSGRSCCTRSRPSGRM